MRLPPPALAGTFEGIHCFGGYAYLRR
jgi:hypothetical protein